MTTKLYFISELPEWIKTSSFMLDYMELNNETIELEISKVNDKPETLSMENIFYVMETVRYFGIEDEMINEDIFKVVYEEFDKTLLDRYNTVIPKDNKFSYYINEFPVILEAIKSIFFIKEIDTAVEHSYPYFLQYCIENTIDMNFPYITKTAFNICAKNGDFKCYEILLKYSEDIGDSVDNANFYGHFEYMKLAYKQKPQQQLYLLRNAISGGSLDCVKFALEHNFSRRGGMSLLYHAIKNRKYEIFKYLIEIEFEKENEHVYDMLLNECVKVGPEYVKLFETYTPYAP